MAQPGTSLAMLVDFGIIEPFLLKLTENEENWQNPNRLMNFFEIWYVDASQQQKNATKKLFWILAFFGRFLTKKQPKLTKS